MNYKQILQDNLRAALQQRGITQAKLAELTGLTEPTISRYLSGTHTPNIEYIALVAAALYNGTQILNHSFQNYRAYGIIK